MQELHCLYFYLQQSTAVTHPWLQSCCSGLWCELMSRWLFFYFGYLRHIFAWYLFVSRRPGVVGIRHNNISPPRHVSRLPDHQQVVQRTLFLFYIIDTVYFMTYLINCNICNSILGIIKIKYRFLNVVSKQYCSSAWGRVTIRI